MTDVVKLTRSDGIAIVAMEDRQGKNTFTRELMVGLLNAFREIDCDETLKVVILHGYDSYFCCGGTQEELLNIFEGKKVFTDGQFYDVLLQCKIPVIAAMQGHALGGGLALGSFADIIILAKQCIYSTNFMKYGFTPGFGSTYIIPKRFGESIAREMLLGAKNYYGSELKEMGVGLRVVDKPDVIETARSIAIELADKPRLSLVTLKKHLNQDIHKNLPGYIEQELDMHKITFTQPEVRDRIVSLFGNS